MSTQVKDKEAFQRLNFLYQAAHCVMSQNPENVELARFYCYTERSISKRLVLRRDPAIKRTECKGCYTLLVPGVTSTVRQRRTGGQRRTVVRCLTCGLVKRFVNNPKYKLWSEQPEALLENQPKKEINLAVPQKNTKAKQKAKGNGNTQGSHKPMAQQQTKGKRDVEQSKLEEHKDATWNNDPEGSKPMEQGYTEVRSDAGQSKLEEHKDATWNNDPEGSKPMEQGYTEVRSDAEQSKSVESKEANWNNDPEGSKPMEQGYLEVRSDAKQNKPSEKPDARAMDPAE